MATESKSQTEDLEEQEIDDDNIPTEIIKSVVKIFVTHCGPWYSQPWEMNVSSSSTSSGFIISTTNREIMCNAHGVVNHTSIRVRKYGESKKYSAIIKYIGHDCDLAVLTVEDNKFWNNKQDELKPIEFMNITPSLQDTITVLGYPKGGDDLSVTQGVISRIGFTNYSHSLKWLLTIQIDAAINDGNSGGPALDINGKLIGVAFQGINDADNIGYCIPVRVIQHFLTSVRDKGSYIVPALALIYSPIENYSMKQYLKMIKIKSIKDDESKDEQEDEEEEEMQGILVQKLFPFTDTADKLKKQDVILSIDDTKVGDDGTIKYGKNSRIDLNYIITNKYNGDYVKLKVLRNGEIIELNVILKEHNPLCPIHLFNKQHPDYYIFGGLVFLPLSRPYLRHKFGVQWENKKASSTLKYVYSNRLRKFKDQQCIILSQVLASDTTIGYHDYKYYILSSISYHQNKIEKEIEIINLKHLALTIDNISNQCIKDDNNNNQFIKFNMESKQMIVLNINKAIKAAKDILKRHKIEYDRSENLRDINDKDDINTDTLDNNGKSDDNDNDVNTKK